MRTLKKQKGTTPALTNSAVQKHFNGGGGELFIYKTALIKKNLIRKYIFSEHLMKFRFQIQTL